MIFSEFILYFFLIFFRTDIWLQLAFNSSNSKHAIQRSLGCVLYEMMTLKRAFHDRPVPGIDSQPYLDIPGFLNLNQNNSIFTPILLK